MVILKRVNNIELHRLDQTSRKQKKHDFSSQFPVAAEEAETAWCIILHRKRNYSDSRIKIRIYLDIICYEIKDMPKKITVVFFVSSRCCAMKVL